MQQFVTLWSICDIIMSKLLISQILDDVKSGNRQEY